MRSAGASLGLVALAGALGALGGWLWWTWWSPGPEGRVYELRAGGETWVPEPSAEQGYAQLFSATGQFVLIGLGFGLLLGVLAGLAFRRRELYALAALLLGTGLAALVMAQVGLALSPPDREALLGSVAVGEQARAGLDVSGWTPYLSWSLGALLGFLAVLLVVIDRPAPPPPPTAAPGPPG